MLVGRTREREALDDALARLTAGAGGLVVALEGEPGIGKSRLLAELAERAGEGCLVLGAAAAEFEDDLPYAIWTEALDRELRELGDRRLSRLGIDDRALAAVLPSLGEPAPADRHAIHRALRELLEALAGTRPLVLWLDDLHWADPGSLDAIAALVRRPPAGAVLLALAAREGLLPQPVATALAAAVREERVTRLALTPLSAAEAAELVGDDAALYRESGGNPFYLEQLARSRGSASAPVEAPARVEGAVPEAVALAIAAELAGLAPESRRVLEAAAIAGDPFDPALAAEVADLPEAAALAGLDDLLARALVRPASGARRFSFRHPVVRHAVYESAPGGWRLAAHARAAAALERRGAGVVARAHHIEHAAELGDETAAAVLAAAASELQGPAPASAARFHAAALRLVPDVPERRQERAAIQVALAEAQSASGDADAARATLLEALAGARDPDERQALTVRIANAEFWLGQSDEALQRLHVALRDLPAEPSQDRIRLHLSLGLTVMLGCEYEAARAQGSDALADARVLGDPVLEAAALGLDAFALAASTPGEAAEALERATGAFDRLPDADLMRRLPGLWMLAWSESALGRFDVALELLGRARRMAAAHRPRARARAGERGVGAAAARARPADGGGGRRRGGASTARGCPATRSSSSRRTAPWPPPGSPPATSARALREAEDAAAIDAPPDFHRAGQPGWCLGAALTAAGNPERGAAAMLEAFGGAAMPRVIPADRPAAAADLVEAQLAAGDLAGAGEALSVGKAAARTRWAATTIARAESAVLLAEGRADEAVNAARSPDETDWPLASALLRLAEGRALAAAGEKAAAVAALKEAEAALDGFGAVRRRDEAVRELRTLGHRVVRAATGRDGRAAHRPRAGDRAAGGGGTDEPRGGGAARAERQDDRGAPAEHLREAGSALAGRAGPQGLG